MFFIKNKSIFILILVTILFSLSCENKTLELSTGKKKLFTKKQVSQTNIDFTNKLIDDPLDPYRNAMSYSNYFIGGGVASGDINNDGLVDLFFVGNEVKNKLFLNQGDFKFKDISEGANINQGKNWSTGVTMVDINNDGWLDIYVSQSSPFTFGPEYRRNLLFINNKNLSFTERAKEYGLDDGNLGRQAAFFDYDKDGDLDCFILNSSKYIRIPIGKVYMDLDANKQNLMDASCNLYRNDEGKFKKVTEQAGMLRYGFGLGLVCADINDDGWPDVYVANDYSVPDFMYINNGDGTFTDEIKSRTNQISFYGMGADISDINNDGLLDIAVVDMAADDHVRDKTLMASMDVKTFRTYVDTLKYQHQYMFNSLQLNNGNGTFSNIVNLSGLAKTDWSWSALFADFDNDSYKDFFVSNGFKRYTRDNDSRIKMKKIRDENGGIIPTDLRKKLYEEIPMIPLSNLIYQNNHKLQFKNKVKEWGIDYPSFSNGSVYADLDNDGDLDLAINNIDSLAFIFQNNSTNNYLKVKLESAEPTINTKVYIHHNGNIQYQELVPTRGYFSSMENRAVYFGLGQFDKIDSLKVIWPDNSKQLIANPRINQTLILKKADAKLKHNYKEVKRIHPIFKQSESNINFVHEENKFDDFEKEILLPHKQSTLGSGIAKGDVDGNGLEDFFIGGAKGQSAELFLQYEKNKFKKSTSSPWTMHASSEDMKAEFFDADGDGDLDLYVPSGGGGDFEIDSPLLQDRLYKNDGKGIFSFSSKALPQLFKASFVVAPNDYDKDGDLDLFVGGRAIPGRYPFAEKSYLLSNESGAYSIKNELQTEQLSNCGLVSDATWLDIDSDGWDDLIVVGEWTSIKVFLNKEGQLEESSTLIGTDDLKGWWYSIEAADVDNDGDLDLICGNVGLNTKFKANKEKPFKVFANDFDSNGTCDIVLSKEYKGKDVPTRGRQCSSDQMPFIKEKFPTYESYATASIEDIYGDKLKGAIKLEANEFRSIILINEGGKFSINYLPNIAQASPVNGIIIKDLNQDKNIDIIIAGNNYDTEVETPRYDAGRGLVLIGNGSGEFVPLSVAESGLYLSKNVKDIKLTKSGSLIVFNNNEKLELYVQDEAKSIQ